MASFLPFPRSVVCGQLHSYFDVVNAGDLGMLFVVLLFCPLRSRTIITNS